MRQALGKGLEALIPKSFDPAAQLPAQSGDPIKVPIDKIRPNHLQPRKHFDPEKLSELSGSIKEHGLAQPILVSYDAQTKSYELIAGERRLRACELAGLKEVEVIVKAPASEQERLALALIENLQREDLNPVEEALGYLRLIKEYQVTQTELTRFVGKSKSAISNTLRILDLPDNMLKALQFQQISEGHARAILMVEDPSGKQKLFALVLSQKLSVRQTEDAAREISGNPSPAPSATSPKRGFPEKSADIRELEASLQRSLGVKVEIKTSGSQNSGRITLHFHSLTDFDKIINIIKK